MSRLLSYKSLKLLWPSLELSNLNLWIFFIGFFSKIPPRSVRKRSLGLLRVYPIYFLFLSLMSCSLNNYWENNLISDIHWKTMTFDTILSTFMRKTFIIECNKKWRIFLLCIQSITKKHIPLFFNLSFFLYNSGTA